MVNIGMVGEYPTDTTCVASLLRQKFKDRVNLYPLIYDIHGSNLENPKIKHQLRREYQIQKPDRVLFIRDLDGLEHEQEAVEKKKAYFSTFNSIVDKKGIFLLNIYELEALLLSDTTMLEDYYKIEMGETGDCMLIADPKGFLQRKIKKYSTGDNQELFSRLKYDQVVQNCRYFKKFSETFAEIVEN